MMEQLCWELEAPSVMGRAGLAALAPSVVGLVGLAALAPSEVAEG